MKYQKLIVWAMVPLIVTTIHAKPKAQPEAEKTAEVQAASAPAPAEAKATAEWYKSIGVVVGYNGNSELSRVGKTYVSGEDAFGVPIWTFGARLKIDRDIIGGRLGLQYSFMPERTHTDSTTAVTALPTKESGSSITVPFSFCINPVRSDRGVLYIGVGIGYSSYTADASFPISATATGATSTKTSGADWNMVIGGEIYLTSYLGLSMELMIQRGFDNKATYSETGSTRTYISVNRNTDFFLVGLNFRF